MSLLLSNDESGNDGGSDDSGGGCGSDCVWLVQVAGVVQYFYCYWCRGVMEVTVMVAGMYGDCHAVVVAGDGVGGMGWQSEERGVCDSEGSRGWCL